MPAASSVETATSGVPTTRIRGLALIFALVLACMAFWILAPELSRPHPVGSPGETRSLADLIANRDAAQRAARFGVIRGDLWADVSLIYSEVLGHVGENKTADDSAAIQEARKVTERALALAPSDAHVWLVLATIISRFDWLNGKASAALRMSFYTGPNEVALIPSRLALAVTLPAISDKDFQQLVAHDIRTIVTRKSELRPTIASAYRSASPEGQQFLRDSLKDLDPALLSNLP